MKKNIKLALNIVFVLLILAWTVFILFIGPNEVIELIGVNNSYLILFISSFLGGFTTVSAATVYPPMIAMVFGGLNLFVVAAIAGTALSLTNICFLYLGFKGHEIIEASSNKLTRFTRKIEKWIEKLPDMALPIFIWCYVALTPLPNNLFMLSLGILEVKFKKVIIPLLLGNFIAMTIIILLVEYVKDFSW